MMGEVLDDPAGVESTEPATTGLGWLPVRTVYEADKLVVSPVGQAHDGTLVRGYEIRHGRIEPRPGCLPWLTAATASDRLGAA